MTYRLIEAHQSFGGIQSVYAHQSDETQCEMRFAIYLPPAAQQKFVPVLYWLSGLTCSEQNFITKAGAQRLAAELGLAIVVPDTSPRGLKFPAHLNTENIGEGASFYVDATEMPWVDHYRMYSYISNELPQVIASNFPIDKKRCGIFGHSMGGHGALTIGLRNHQKFHSLSAFAPICAPTQTPWGINAFHNYLGDNKKTWQQYDACHLIRTYGWSHGEILIDQGHADPFLEEQLKPELLSAACLQANVPLNLRMHEKYSHNYYFIATFIEDHLRFHAKKLTNHPE
jgi:S-formylglutathione hydrolase